MKLRNRANTRRSVPAARNVYGLFDCCLWVRALLFCGLLATPSAGRQPDAQTHAELAVSALRQGTPTRQPEELAAPIEEWSPAPEQQFGPADQGSGFPPLPPDPYEDDHLPLPPLDEELWNHGGSYLYSPEGDRLNWPDEHAGNHFDVLRLPEDWVEPKPWTLFSEFLGADPIYTRPWAQWPGPAGYLWDKRLVGYGRLSLIGLSFEQSNQRQDAFAQQLLLDVDLRLTGTERFHVQFRPLGRDNTGGSYYQFNSPSGYVDNFAGAPQRYWFEGEVASLLGSYLSPFTSLDLNFAVGRFPVALQNNLLINDEFLGAALAKNNVYLGPLSNLNVQLFCGLNDVSAFADSDGQLYGVSAQADHRKAFYELNYVFLRHDSDSGRDAHFAGLSRTQFYGPVSVAGRALFKWGDEGGRGAGQLFTLESNWTRAFDENLFHIDKGVFYGNAFLVTKGWNSIAGGNFNQLRSSFETNPLVRIAAGLSPAQNWGLALGVQLFRRHQDESLTPEISFESPEGDSVVGCGIRYLRKTGSRAYWESLFTMAFSDDPRFDRRGAIWTYHILF